MTRPLTSVASLALALALAACAATAPERTPNSDAAAQVDAFFGTHAGGGSAQNLSPRPAALPGASAATQAALPGPNDPSVDWSNPCTANLDEITGALLAYYAVHKVLPPTLDDIPKISPSGETISLTCPESGKRYIYYPQGLRPPVFFDDSQNGQAHLGNVLILYDAEPTHFMIQHFTDGTHDYDVKKPVRFGIVMEPRRGVFGQPVQMYVVPIEQGILDMYLKINQAPANGS